MAKAVRMSDIGKRLGVSTVTVSKALSGQKGVGTKLREDIIRLADEMGYVKASTGALEEKELGSFTIGVVVAERFLDEKQSFYWKLYQEISMRAIARNCFPIMEVVSYDAEKLGEMPKVITEKKADGLIVMGAFRQEYVKAIISGASIPLLNLDTTYGWEECDCVVSNNMLGGYAVTNYLFEKGHREIGFVGTRLATGSIDDRFFGYLRSLLEHGVSMRQDWLIEDRDRTTGMMDYETKFLLPREMPTAFFCNCDKAANYLIRKLQEKGYRVPEDISVAGFDNYIPDQSVNIGLTTYEIDTKEMAKRAVHILLMKLTDREYSSGMFVLKGRFIERESVKRLADPVPFV